MDQTAYLPVELVTRPTSEPLTLSEVKKHLEVSSTDDSHDAQLSQMVIEAREQWERDTDSVMCYQSYRLKTDFIDDKFPLQKRPLHSITSIKYYDGNNTQQTLSTNVYQLDTARKQIRLAYGQTLPSVIDRWDAWEVIYKCGYSADGSLVPAIAKRAMLLLIGHYFENRDMLVQDRMTNQISLVAMYAYEALVKKYLRSSYP
jgi:uncharacterized phiE125 gp8 family phage protein